MSRQRQRQRVEGQGGDNAARQVHQSNNSGGGGGGRSRRSRNRRRRDHHRGEQRSSFWGDPTALPEASADVEITDDASAVARSLGPPPLPGHEAVAAHYFRVVYDRAVMTAGALAAAGGLISTEALTGDDD